MAFMAGCSSNGCRKPRVERWRRREWALWTFGSVHGGTDIGYLSRGRADGCSLYREAPAAMSRWASERLSRAYIELLQMNFQYVWVRHTFQSESEI